MACSLPDGSVVLNHDGSRSRFGLGRKAGGVLLAIGSCLPDTSAPLDLPEALPLKKVYFTLQLQSSPILFLLFISTFLFNSIDEG